MLTNIRAWWARQKKWNEKLTEARRQDANALREAEARRQAEDPFAIREDEQPPLTGGWSGPV